MGHGARGLRTCVSQVRGGAGSPRPAARCVVGGTDSFL